MKYIIVLQAIFLLSTTIFANAKPSRTLKIWDRGETFEIVEDLNTLNSEERQLFDVQYGKSQIYKGISLKNILAHFKVWKKNSENNLALLHFKNNMIIPIDRDQLKDPNLDPFVALQFKSSKKDKKWKNEFHEVSKPTELHSDPRPITFIGNKVIFPGQVDKKLFSPWRHADSLMSIELVNKEAYYAQFPRPKSGPGLVGFSVFIARCQNCHGVRKLGAQFGWDFVEPLPVYKKRQPDSLLLHVKYPYFMAVERGLMMPNQKDFTKKEASDIWEWMKYAAETRNNPYKSKK